MLSHYEERILLFSTVVWKKLKIFAEINGYSFELTNEIESTHMYHNFKIILNY